MTKQERKEYMKAWYQAHKEEEKTKKKAWREAHKEYIQAWNASHKKHCRDYQNADLNSLGKTKTSIRAKSNRYLYRYGQKIDGYEIHHCCTYNEPYKFIYCSRQIHKLIHEYLRAHNIDADSNHYEYIKHLLDDTVVKYNVQ